jgi:hypothetical protein
MNKCRCRFCMPSRALERLAARLQDDEVAALDVAELRTALDAWYEESFEAQFDLDVIAGALGMDSAIGITRQQIIDAIHSKEPPAP